MKVYYRSLRERVWVIHIVLRHFLLLKNSKVKLIDIKLRNSYKIYREIQNNRIKDRGLD